MSGLADFLLARIAEDEAVARAATPFGPAGPTLPTLDGRHVLTDGARHIARHDPARVLAECEAKRRIVAWAYPPRSRDDVGDEVLRLLALPYADHPDYREEWKP